ncbi:MAG: hypothetical protein CBC04_00685 [Verrucomicrobia bacterium TMED44]|nr:MAG: hypothetical protein CBC04_00685 [Verrucomicrobia bacterium TMED44]
MKIDTVILSSNDNPDYIQFWPIVSEAWTLMGIEPILIYTGEQKLKLKGNVISFYSKNMNSSFVSQNIRILYPSLLDGKTCIVSDIDNLPLSKNYFINSVVDFDSNSFIIYRPDACPPNMISMMWNAANSNTWKEIFSIDSEKNIEKILKKWYTKKYTVEGAAWYTDQIKLRKYVNKFAKKNKSRIVELNDDELGFYRFNRNRLEKHLNMINESPNLKFTDFHMPRPFNEYDELINKVFEYHKKYIIG